MLDAPNVTDPCLRCSSQTLLSACCSECIELTHEELKSDVSQLRSALHVAEAKLERIARAYDALLAKQTPYAAAGAA
jgi:hypothetical protein